MPQSPTWRWPLPGIDDLCREVLRRPASPGGGAFAYTLCKPAPGQPVRTPIEQGWALRRPGVISPDSWADSGPTGEGFVDVVIDEHVYTWQFGSRDEAMSLMATKSPLHVNLLASLMTNGNNYC